MRIGITCYPSHGGSGVVATELGKALAERGHEVAFVSYATPLRLGDQPARVSFYEVPQFEYPLFQQHFPHCITLASRMAEVARMRKLQVLHVHYAIPFTPAAMLARQIAHELDLKVVTTLHGTDVTLVGQNPIFAPITQVSIRNSDAVTAVSHWLRDETRRAFGCERDIDVIYNFVDPRRYAAREALCVPPLACPEQVTLTHISNFRPVKRISDVMEVFARVRRQMRARLLLVGEGPDSSLAMRMANELGVTEDIVFVGVVDAIEPVLACSDLLLLPSESESFGLVALEAMAAGVPVIGADAGGLPEVVVAGETGYLAPVGDVAAMADHAIGLLRDPERRRRMGAAAQQRAFDQFPVDKIVPQYEAVYQRVVGGER